MDSTIALILGASLLTAFGVLVFVLPKGISKLSGWTALAEKFPVTEPYQGEWLTRQSAYARGLSINDCLEIGSNDRFLYIAIGLPFFDFDKLQIPWEAITDVKPDGNWLFLNIDGLPVRLTRSSFDASAIGRMLN
ncbi:MAG: hypothetical protein SGJ27_02220 [Candidatus Melainabacteria bacterium]|nr:hypothetical protein [Candidatus Melainabacteria bacterium]